MRAFIVLCLVAAACADQLGYNYQPVGHSSNSVPSFDGLQGGANFAAGSSSGPSYAGSQGVSDYAAGSNAAPSFAGSQVVSDYAAGSNAAPSFVGAQGVSDYAAGSNAAPSFVGSQGVSDFAAGSNAAPSYAGQASHDNAAFAPQAELEKEFFTYTANEEDFNEPAASNQLSNSLKQGLRVVFIKGPENSGLENAALALAKHGSEQKTDIYVLQKQADLSSLANKLNTDNKNINNKPEVHFVKYRTPEDAANAQKAIQGQYDSLGGSSQSHDGGVAPVLNFASKAPVASHGSSGSLGAGSLGSGSFGSLGSGSFGSGSNGAGSLGLGSFGAGSVGAGSFGAGSVGFGSHGAVSNVGASYISPSAGAGVSAPGPSYLPASIFRRL